MISTTLSRASLLSKVMVFSLVLSIGTVAISAPQVAHATPKGKPFTTRVLRTVKRHAKLITAGVVLSSALFWGSNSYNGTQVMNLQTQNARSTMGQTEKSRGEALTNLARTAGRYLGHEHSIVKEITAARKALGAAKTSAERSAAQSRLTSVLGSLDAHVLNFRESRIDTHGHDLMRDMMKSINSHQASVEVARRRYNNAAAAYNGRLTLVPHSLVSKLTGFEKAPLLEASAAETVNPTLDFGQ